MHFMWLNKYNSLYSGYLDVKEFVVCPACYCAQPAAPVLVVSVLPPLISLKLFCIKLLWLLLCQRLVASASACSTEAAPCGQGKVGEVHKQPASEAHGLTIWSITPGGVPLRVVAGEWAGSGPGEQDGLLGLARAQLWLPPDQHLCQVGGHCTWLFGCHGAKEMWKRQGQRLGSRWCSFFKKVFY